MQTKSDVSTNDDRYFIQTCLKIQYFFVPLPTESAKRPEDMVATLYYASITQARAGDYKWQI